MRSSVIYCFCQILVVILVSLRHEAIAQHTSLDTLWGKNLRSFRSIFLNVMGRSGDDPNNLELANRRGVSHYLIFGNYIYFLNFC